MKKHVVRLEQALKLWDDMCFLTKKHIETLSLIHEEEVEQGVLNGALWHSSEFVEHVIQKGGAGYFDHKRFVDLEEESGKLIMHSWIVPFNIFSWNRHSRRVFHLTPELQTLFSATSLEGICWDDIKWPFRSFVLTLDEPIRDARGYEFDCILVSDIASIVEKWKEFEIFDFLLMSKNLDERKMVDRDKIQKMATPRKWNDVKMSKKLLNIGNNYLDHFFVSIKGTFGTNHEQVSIPLSVSSVEARKEAGLEEANGSDEYDRFSIFDKAKHLVISTCLYLATLPAKKFPENWQRVRRLEPTGMLSMEAVTTADGIFKIASESILSKETQETIDEIRQSRASREKRPHWRRGHWRKIWGGKEDPNAPRIWVLPCLVNKHRLPENSLPIASKVVLET